MGWLVVAGIYPGGGPPLPGVTGNGLADAIRAGSGGAGRWHGGNGGVRKIRFLAPMTAAILSNNRLHAPFGMAGGAPGAPGVNLVVRADGRVEQLGHIGKTAMAAGDVFVIETPGGGGYGAP